MQIRTQHKAVYPYAQPNKGEQLEPMLRREEFAVSLRRQRKKQIIETKRKRLPLSM